jgi:hypothetical protein
MKPVHSAENRLSTRTSSAESAELKLMISSSWSIVNHSGLSPSATFNGHMAQEQRKALPAYLEEVAFHFNRRKNANLFLDTLRHMLLLSLFLLRS